MLLTGEKMKKVHLSGLCGRGTFPPRENGSEGLAQNPLEQLLARG